MNPVNEHIEYSNKIREICLRYYMPQKKLANGQDNPEYHPTLVAEATYGAECMVSIANVFRVLETNHPAFILPVIVDLSFGLSENQFWKQHGNILVPLYKSALHSAISSRVLAIQFERSPEQEELMIRQRKQWYSIVLMGFDCIHGVIKAMNVNSALTQELDRVQ